MKKFLPLFLFIFSYSPCQIPKSLDSLKTYIDTKPKDTNYVSALNEYAFIIIKNGKYEEGKKIITQMELLSKQLNYGSGFYKSTNMKGVMEFVKQNPEKAMEYFKNANEIILKYKLPNKIYQNSLNNIGIIYNQMGDRENATKYAIKLIDFQEKKKLNPLKSSPYTQVGDNLKFYKKYNEALQYYQKALQIETDLKDHVGIAIGNNRIGNLYEDLKNNKAALNYFKKGLFFAEKADYKLLKCELLTNLGRIYQKENDFVKAEDYLKKAEVQSRELEATQTLKVVCSNLGDLYFSQKKYQLSKKYYLEALQIAKEIKDPEFSYSANQALADLFEKEGDYKKAFTYKVDAEIAKDSIFKIKTLENTENLLRKYQTEKKEQEIKTLSTQNKLKNLQIDIANRKIYYAFAGLFLLSCIGFLFYKQSENRKRNNLKLSFLNQELEKANKTKTQLFGILNHDLRSPLAGLIHFLQLQKDSPEILDEATKQRLQNKTFGAAENLLVQMEDLLLWSKGQMEHFEPKKTQVPVSQIFQDIADNFSFGNKVKISFENPENLQVFTDNDYLKTITRNLTNNAIKILDKIENPTIVWKAINHKSFVELMIIDNGKGATPEKFRALFDENVSIGIKTGLGMHLIRDLSKAIDAEISVNSVENVGTRISLIIENKK
ncbi:Tetratricopeptide repeat-containing protein [Halpernia humi]|uniref:histidine kinase n=1 Tax=Halpernia humi TaxID=493375 RepID=A0A1H6A5P5_9FLAO|nr:tetratricopeptide repeat protein [Halpernia humi]SEG43365.1 Tetratricopeptide repeat-containing protein [Halpernia humi]